MYHLVKRGYIILQTDTRILFICIDVAIEYVWVYQFQSDYLRFYLILAFSFQIKREIYFMTSLHEINWFSARLFL